MGGNMKVMLFSGGLDSYIISKLVNPDINLYISIGSKYCWEERCNLIGFDDETYDKIYVNEYLDLGEEELSNAIVPMRNLFFIMIGLYYGNHIILGATRGDTTLDKDLIFRDKAKNLLRYLFKNKEKNPKYWKEDMDVQIELPYKGYTKAQLVKEYLDKGLSKKWLYKTRSCYGTTGKECGVCKSCFRKAVALAHNNIYDKNLFLEDPLKNPTLAKEREGESEETKEVLRNYCG